MNVLQDMSLSAMAASNEANLYASSPFSCNLPLAEIHKGLDVSWCITDIPLLPCNIVFKAHLKPEQVDGTIESVIDKARRRNVPLRWSIGSGTEPVDLGEHLLAHGFTTSGPGPMMAIDLYSMKKDVPALSNFSVAEVKHGTAFDTWCHFAAMGFGIQPEREPAMSRWFNVARDSGLQMHFYLALLDGKPVATSQLFLAEGVAGIFYVTTIPEARRRGIGRAITLKPLRVAMAKGYRVGVLQASKLGEGVYRGIGFQECGRITNYHWRNAPPVH